MHNGLDLFSLDPPVSVSFRFSDGVSFWLGFRDGTALVSRLLRSGDWKLADPEDDLKERP